MKISKHLSILAAAICFTLAASAQINSPYSKFGYGLLNDNASAAQRQMGSVGYAMNSGRHINVMNPASYAAADSLTFLFDMGVDLTFINQKEGAVGDTPAASSNSNGGGLDYVTLQVPIGKRMGASLGLVPFSSVGYSFGSEIENGVNSRQGTGGINQLYLGFAGKIFKGFSLGANISYLFGTTINDVFVTADPANGTSTTTLFEKVMEVRDWRLQIGAQYNLDINTDNRMTFGLVYTPGKKLLGKSRIVQYDVNADEAPNTEDIPYEKLKEKLADSWGIGVSYTWKKKLMVEADFTYQPWSKEKGIFIKDFETTQFADRYQFGLGAEFTPAVRGNYFKRMTYRVGGFYNRDYIMVDNNNVREYGISCGFGFPALSSKTQINLGLEYRKRQATPNPLLQESYFCIRLGINFNELWFFQNKIK